MEYEKRSLPDVEFSVYDMDGNCKLCAYYFFTSDIHFADSYLCEIVCDLLLCSNNLVFLVLPVAETIFGLYAAEDILIGGDIVIPADTLIETAVSDKTFCRSLTYSLSLYTTSTSSPAYSNENSCISLFRTNPDPAVTSSILYLPSGRYYRLEEIAAADGYVKGEPIEFILSSDQAYEVGLLQIRNQ